MKIFLGDKLKNRNVKAELRAAGYHVAVGGRTGEQSYARRIGRQEFPHFHVYIAELPDGLSLNLHLDQKRPSYEGFSAHGGEYEGGIVGAEAERLQKLFNR